MEKEILKKASAFFAQEIKYLFIVEHKKVWLVGLMCQFFNVKRSGFYDYLKNRIHRKNELEAELIG